MDKHIKYILTDIEGTTSSVDFVYDVLFPYFKAHIQLLTQHAQINEVKQAFAEVIELAAQEDGVHLTTTQIEKKIIAATTANFNNFLHLSQNWAL